MLFNSTTFLLFFAVFLLLYYSCRNSLRARNVLIVAASYVFYGAWDYRFLSLLVFTSVLDYGVGLGLDRFRETGRRKLLLILSIAVNLSLLGIFKYHDFFVESFRALLARLDIPVHTRTLGLILPVGISFYTFQSMSYAMDVYRRHVPATRDLVNFLAYVSFFPQLVAGPIERAAHLLPQFHETRVITRGMLQEGIWLTLWGMFKKVVIADNLAPLVDMVFQNPGPIGGPAVALATVAFGGQIYCDFSGYSDIARGTARILGFDILFNFNIPYAAADLREFWRRWHISLSTWLRDYLYISLGGNRKGELRTFFNLSFTMALGGLWHGAAWSFMLWGLWHGCGLVLHRIWEAGRHRAGRLPRWCGWILTMLFVFYGWLLFRARSLEQVVSLTASLGDWTIPIWLGSYGTTLGVFLLPVVLMEIWQEKRGNRLVALTLPGWARSGLQAVLLAGILIFWEKEGSPFIYFNF